MLQAVRRKIKKFRIKKSVAGIPHHTYVDGYFETSNPRLIAMLKRLPDTTAEELSDGTEIPEVRGMEARAEPIEEMGWFDLRKRAKEAGVFRRDMKKSELIAALMRKRGHGISNRENRGE